MAMISRCTTRRAGTQALGTQVSSGCAVVTVARRCPATVWTTKPRALARLQTRPHVTSGGSSNPTSDGIRQSYKLSFPEFSGELSKVGDHSGQTWKVTGDFKLDVEACRDSEQDLMHPPNPENIAMIDELVANMCVARDFISEQKLKNLQESLSKVFNPDSEEYRNTRGLKSPRLDRETQNMLAAYVKKAVLLSQAPNRLMKPIGPSMAIKHYQGGSRRNLHKDKADYDSRVIIPVPFTSHTPNMREGDKSGSLLFCKNRGDMRFEIKAPELVCWQQAESKLCMAELHTETKTENQTEYQTETQTQIETETQTEAQTQSETQTHAESKLYMAELHTMQ
eukprot:gene6286-2918_t